MYIYTNRAQIFEMFVRVTISKTDFKPKNKNMRGLKATHFFIFSV